MEWYRSEHTQAIPSGLYSDHTAVLLCSNSLKLIVYKTKLVWREKQVLHICKRGRGIWPHRETLVRNNWREILKSPALHFENGWRICGAVMPEHAQVQGALCSCSSRGWQGLPHTCPSRARTTSDSTEKSDAASAVYTLKPSHTSAFKLSIASESKI